MSPKDEIADVKIDFKGRRYCLFWQDTERVLGLQGSAHETKKVDPMAGLSSLLDRLLGQSGGWGGGDHAVPSPNGVHHPLPQQ